MDPVTLAAGIGGAAGKLGEGLLSIGGGLLSAHAQYKYQKRLMQRQFELANETRRRYYSDTRYSLEKAGFNPVLAFGGASGGGGGFTASTSGAPAPDLSVGGATEAVESAIALKQRQDEIDLAKEKQKKELELKEKEANAEVAKKEAEVQNINADTVNKPLQGAGSASSAVKDFVGSVGTGFGIYEGLKALKKAGDAGAGKMPLPVVRPEALKHGGSLARYAPWTAYLPAATVPAASFFGSALGAAKINKAMGDAERDRILQIKDAKKRDAEFDKHKKRTYNLYIHKNPFHYEGN